MFWFVLVFKDWMTGLNEQRMGRKSLDESFRLLTENIARMNNIEVVPIHDSNFYKYVR